MNDAVKLKQRLNDQIEAVCRHLLPNGKKQGNEWVIGGVDGHSGESMGVNIGRGAKCGVWSDFATGETGDIIELWRAVRDLGQREAFQEIRDYLGVSEPSLARPSRPKVYKAPIKPKNLTKPRDRVLDYLTEDRNLSQEAIDAYKIGSATDRQGQPAIVFPFVSPNEKLELVKVREAKDGGACKPTSKDCKPVLFGWQAIPKEASVLYITEGEIDAPSMWMYGYPALSVPFGGGDGAKQQWIEHEYENILPYEKIYLCLDSDEPGEVAAQAIASRLGRHRCCRVTLPRKDANQCIQEGVTRAEIAQCIADAKSMDPEGLKSASDFLDDVVDLFHGDAALEGYYLPYPSLRDKFRIRPGEVTLWSGKTGEGKSQALSDATTDWIAQGSRICVASLEMQPKQTLRRMVKQISGIDKPSSDAIKSSIEWANDNLLLYDYVGRASLEILLEVFDYAHQKYGCDQFIIDSLMRLGIAGDDYKGQDDAVFKIVNWAVASNVHVHLVAHARKPASGQSGPMNNEDVRGSGGIIDNVANIISIHRRRDVEEDIKGKREAGLYDEAQEIERSNPPVVYTLSKNRNGDWSGTTGMWFDLESYRYRDRYYPDNSRNYLDLYSISGQDQPS